MRNFWKMAILLGVVVAAAVLYLFVPPLPAPETLVDRPYSSLVRELGEPNASIPDKFVQWSVSRMGVNWFIEANYPEGPNAISASVSRQLWIGPRDGAYPIFQQVAHSKKNQRG